MFAYRDFSTVEAAYLEFAETVTEGGLLVACADPVVDAQLVEQIEHAAALGEDRLAGEAAARKSVV